MPAPLLVFDLDGTLVDSAPDLLATLNVVLPRHGFESDRDPTLRDGIGHGARHLIEFALHRQKAAASSSQLDAMHADFLDYYEANICEETRLYPGIEDLLDRFSARGWRFAVCTNKVEALSRLVLEKLGVAERFAAVAGGDTFPTRKPHPAHLIGTIERAAGAPETSIMLGDSRTDLDTARGAGVPAIGVTFGYTPVPMAELKPEYLLDSYDALTPEIATGLFARRDRRQSDAARTREPAAAIS